MYVPCVSAHAPHTCVCSCVHACVCVCSPTPTAVTHQEKGQAQTDWDRLCSWLWLPTPTASVDAPSPLPATSAPQLLPTSAELSAADPPTEPWSEGPHPRPCSPGQGPPPQPSSRASDLPCPLPGASEHTGRIRGPWSRCPAPHIPLVRAGHCEMGAGKPPQLGVRVGPGPPAQCQVIASAGRRGCRAVPAPWEPPGLGARRAGRGLCGAQRRLFKCSIGEGLKFTQGHRGCDNYNHRFWLHNDSHLLFPLGRLPRPRAGDRRGLI